MSVGTVDLASTLARARVLGHHTVLVLTGKLAGLAVPLPCTNAEKSLGANAEIFGFQSGCEL